MSKKKKTEQASARNAIEAAEETTGNVVAWQAGSRCRFPGDAGAPREALAQCFEDHGFKAAAKELRGISTERALVEVVSREGRTRSNRCTRAHGGRNGTTTVTYEIGRLREDKAGGHKVAFGVYCAVTADGETGKGVQCGARVFVADDQVHVAPPVGEDQDAVCMELARELADRAFWTVHHAPGAHVSGAVSCMFGEGGGFPWLARGSYVFPEGKDETERVRRCCEALRSGFYDAKRRTGIRARCIPVRGDSGGAEAFSDAILDELESQLDGLRGDAQDHASRDNVKEGTLRDREKKAGELLQRVEEYAGLLGDWATRFRSVGEAIQEAYAEALRGGKLDIGNLADDDEPVSVQVPTKRPDFLEAPAKKAPKKPRRKAEPALPPTGTSKFDL